MALDPNQPSDPSHSAEDAVVEPSDAVGAAEDVKLPRRIIRRRQAARWFEQTRIRYPWLDPVIKWTVALLGVLLIVLGIAIAPLPGPGGFVAFFGIALLASEFRWARKITRQAQALGHRVYVRVTGRKPRTVWRWKKRMSSGSSPSRRTAGEAM